MKIVTQAAVLASALSLVAAAVRSNSKVAAAIRFVAAEGSVTVTCSSPNIAVTAKVDADVIEPGQVAVVSDRLTALAAGFATSAKIMISGAETGMVTIEGGYSRSRLPVIPIDDLPTVLAIDGEIGHVEISGADLLSLLSPLPAADTERTRFYLCGVFWQSVGDRLVAVSTNGRRLIRTSVTASRFSEGRDLIVASETAAVLFRIIKSIKPGTVTLHRSRTLLAVTGPDFSFTSRLIASKFPEYEAVIPAASPNTIICDRTELLAALARLAAVATVEPPLLALSFDSASQLQVFLARQPGDGRDAIDAETTGQALVAIPLGQLIDMVEEFRGDRLHIDAASGQPLVLRGDDEKLALVMPSAWNFVDAAAPSRSTRERSS